MEEILSKLNEYYPQDENYNKELAKELCILFDVSITERKFCPFCKNEVSHSHINCGNCDADLMPS